MPEFLVVDVNPGRRLMVLVDRLGKYQVALGLRELPPAYAVLRGPTPYRGLSLLSELRTSQVYPVHLVAIDCSQTVAFEMLHETVAIAPLPAVDGRPRATGARASLWPAENWDSWDSRAGERRGARDG